MRALIETGELERARELLTPLVGVLPRQAPEFSEAAGLLGRIHKQRFVASPSKSSPEARAALLHAVDAYRAGYDANRKDNIWHGLNVVALLAAARRHKISTASRRNEKSLARTLLAHLEETPESLRHSWDLASIAELHLALGHWAEFGEQLRRYMENPEVNVLELNSFLRQLTGIWELESDPHGAPYIAALRARVLSTPGGSVELRPTLTSPPPFALVPHTVDKMSDHTTLQWLRVALDRGKSVGAVMDRSERRLGTCFLVHARDVGIKRDECLVLTASHVVSTVTKTAAKPKDITVSFEASGSPRRFKIAKEVWTSSVDELDATLLRLERPPQDLPGLPLASELPSLEVPQRVYLIGHAGGQQLGFSLQDNELLDHEGPPDGTPAIPGVVRLHYRAPTQAGSSGSPVFDSEWRVITLHHSGGRETVRLNGRPGTYEANEGIWIQSIAAALK